MIIPDNTLIHRQELANLIGSRLASITLRDWAHIELTRLFKADEEVYREHANKFFPPTCPYTPQYINNISRWTIRGMGASKLRQLSLPILLIKLEDDKMFREYWAGFHWDVFLRSDHV